MGIQVVVTGVLHKDPVSRMSQNGNPYATCNVRVEQDGQTLWANVICFNEQAQEELLQLKGGDALGVRGKAAPKVYMKGDEAYASLQITASAIYSLEPQPDEFSPAPKRHEAYPPPFSSARSAKAAPRKTAARPKTPAPAVERVADDGFDDPLDF